MARLYTGGAELGHAQAEGLIVGATPTIDTAVKRTGTASYKATAVNTYHRRDFGGVLGRAYFFRSYWQFSNNPTGLHRPFQIATGAGGLVCYLELNHVGRVLRMLDNASAIVATGTTALVAGQWYRIELELMVPAAGSATYELRIDGVTEFSGTVALGNTAPNQFRWGCTSGNIGAITAIYNDDVAINDDQGADQFSWPGAGSVFALLGAADPNTGTAQANWTKPAGATTNRHTSLDNIPPIYQADSTVVGDAEKFLRNPTNALSQLEIDVADYTAAGVPAGEAVTLVQPVAGTGSTSATDTAGVLECLSNPVVATKAMTTYDNGIASTVATTWPRADGNVAYWPTVVRGTRPRLRLTKNAANRVVMANLLALLVETAPPGVPETQAVDDGFALADACSPFKTTPPTGGPPVTSGLAVWLDASQLALADEAAVTTWPDLSGAARHLTTALAPTFQTNELNGLPGVLFDGVDDYLTHLAGSPFVTGDQVTVFAVARRGVGTSNGRMMAFNAQGRETDDYGTPCWCIYEGGGNDRIAPYSNGELAIQVPHPTGAFVMATWFDGTDHNLRVDGAPSSTPSFSMAQMEPFTDFATTRITLASGWFGTPSSTGNYVFHEVVVYDRALDSTERGQVETYLTEKWLSAPGGTGHTRGIDDGIAFIDATTRAATYKRAPADGLGLTDARSRAAGWKRTRADALGLTDLAVPLKAGAPTGFPRRIMVVL